MGELKAAREALDAHYRAFITYLNAVQEIQPEEDILQAAQYHNQNLQKIELQIAQSRKGGSVSPKPESGDSTASGSGGSTGNVTPVQPENGGGSSSSSGDNGGGNSGYDEGS